MAVHSVEDEGHAHAHDGASEEGHEDHLLLNINLCAWPSHKVHRKTNEGNLAEQVCPNISRLCVDPKN